MRRYDLDWLRIGAFGLLNGYHVGMLYVPWAFHVKSAYSGGPLTTALMLALNPWRLSLLFVVSGLATGYMMRTLDRNALARRRAWRLGIPLLFSMVVAVVPQVYFEVIDAGRYQGSFLAFWSRYLRGDQRFRTPIPTWNHLWFVAYLLVLHAVRHGARHGQARADARCPRGTGLGRGAELNERSEWCECAMRPRVEHRRFPGAPAQGRVHRAAAAGTSGRAALTSLHALQRERPGPEAAFDLFARRDGFGVERMASAA
ncbi:acyltransferase [Pseudorhodoferax sp. Leaf267]|uniref:acyltransferase family protein n=1 Tax=Pseudorhodoferax sp. Leaf267 TaxID=1736316 RepID=UPI0006F623F3|nr:acyltransferase [Pseudorhodoferax sp. Leaf267]KQP23068.1 hypothetical protein ASF43_04075 [Pseudorhodoferax sp. Leaf267]